MNSLPWNADPHRWNGRGPISLLRKIPFFAGVLDRSGRFVFISDELLEKIGTDFESMSEVLGKRPGDVFRCRNAAKDPAGCGSYKDCRFCTVAKAMFSSLETEYSVTEEAAILTSENSEFDGYRFSFRSWHSDEEIYILMSFVAGMRDTRSEQLDKVFIHDLTNASGSLIGLLGLLSPPDSSEPAFLEDLNRIEDVARQIYQEVYTHSLLSQNRTETYEPRLVPLVPEEVLKTISRTIQPMLGNQEIVLEFDDSSSRTINSDQTILYRVVFNMVRNAVEADGPDGKVVLAYRSVGKRPEFSVRNSRLMTEEESASVFHPGWSTKGRGRGWGTYAMKQLGENVLGGEVFFTTSEEDGTVFVLRLPESPE